MKRVFQASDASQHHLSAEFTFVKNYLPVYDHQLSNSALYTHKSHNSVFCDIVSYLHTLRRHSVQEVCHWPLKATLNFRRSRIQTAEGKLPNRQHMTTAAAGTCAARLQTIPECTKENLPVSFQQKLLEQHHHFLTAPLNVNWMHAWDKGPAASTMVKIVVRLKWRNSAVWSISVMLIFHN